jgi:hypothetical protein
MNFRDYRGRHHAPTSGISCAQKRPWYRWRCDSRSLYFSGISFDNRLTSITSPFKSSVVTRVVNLIAFTISLSDWYRCASCSINQRAVRNAYWYLVSLFSLSNCALAGYALVLFMICVLQPFAIFLLCNRTGLRGEFFSRSMFARMIVALSRSSFARRSLICLARPSASFSR